MLETGQGREGGDVSIPVREQLEALVDLDSEQYRLTEWEVEFVDAMDKRTSAGESLTEKMEETISGIYDAVFIHGRKRRSYQ